MATSATDARVPNPGLGNPRLYQTVIAGIATLGGFLFGYDTGVVSGALVYIARDLGLNAAEQGIVVSCLLVGAAFGATFGGKLADRIGRKNAIRCASVLFIIATLGSALAPDAVWLIASRVVLGLAVGCVSATVPLYIGEIASTERRGRLVNQNELMIVTGQLLAYVINAVVIQLISGEVAWRWMLGVAVIPALLLFVGLWFVPETPRWYASRERYAEAEHVLHRVRDASEIPYDLRLMRETAQRRHDHEGRSGWVYLRARWIRILLLIGVGVSITQQITGLNAIVYYAPTVLENSGLGVSASVTASISVGAIGVVAVSIGMYLVGRINRRPMIITGQIGTITALVVLALSFLLPHSDVRSYVILGLMVLFVAFQQCFISVVTWLMLSELFPMKIRGFAMGIAVFMQWAANFGVSLSFPILNSSVGPTWTFLVFAGLGLAALGFTTTCLPETKGHSLEELETRFHDRYSSQ